MIKFELNEKERKMAEDFHKEHDPICPNPPEDRAIWLGDEGWFVPPRAGTYLYVFNHNSGIGQGSMIQCTCGARKDITDIDAW